MSLKVFLPALLIVSVLAVSGCTQQLSSSNTSPGETVQPDGTIIKSDGTMVKPNGVMIKPDGTMLPPEGSPAGTTVEEDGTIVKPDGTMVKPDGTMILPDGSMVEPPAGYSGQVLAGSATPYIRYNQMDFQKARSQGKTIFLYFYASWCPICNSERPNILAAFNEMSFADVIGFEVHYSDSQVTESDQQITQQYQVPYQHTSIVLDHGGAVALKSLQPLGKEEIKSAIASARG